MRVYYNNQISAAGMYGGLAVGSNALAEGYELPDLYDPFLSRVVKFADTCATVSIGASFTFNCFIDTVWVIGERFHFVNVRLTDWSGKVIGGEIDITAEYQGFLTAVKLPGCYMAKQLVISITGDPPIILSYLYAGFGVEFPRFLVKPKTALSIQGKGSQSDGGQAYGIKRPSLRTLGVSFENIDTSVRRRMEHYLNSVQFVEPHIIEPYDTPEFPPMYGVLTDGGSFDKRDRPGFFYDTSMAWREAR